MVYWNRFARRHHLYGDKVMPRRWVWRSGGCESVWCEVVCALVSARWLGSNRAPCITQGGPCRPPAFPVRPPRPRPQPLCRTWPCSRHGARHGGGHTHLRGLTAAATPAPRPSYLEQQDLLALAHARLPVYAPAVFPFSNWARKHPHAHLCRACLVHITFSTCAPARPAHRCEEFVCGREGGDMAASPAFATLRRALVVHLLALNEYCLLPPDCLAR